MPADSYALSLELSFNDLASEGLKNVSGLLTSIESQVEQIQKKFDVFGQKAVTINNQLEDSVKQVNASLTQTNEATKGVETSMVAVGAAAQETVDVTSDMGDKLKDISDTVSKLSTSRLFTDDPQAVQDIVDKMKIMNSEVVRIQDIQKNSNDITASQNNLLRDAAEITKRFNKDRAEGENRHEKMVKDFQSKNKINDKLEMLNEVQMRKLSIDERSRLQDILKSKKALGIAGSELGGDPAAVDSALALASGIQDQAVASDKFKEKIAPVGGMIQKVFATGPLGPFISKIGTAGAAFALIETIFGGAAARAEKFHTANFRALGSMEDLASRSALLTGALRMTNKEVDDAVIALREAGAAADGFDDLIEGMVILGRSTGVSAQSVAEFSVQMKGAGASTESIQGSFAAANAAAKGLGLTGHDLDKVLMQSGRSAFYMGTTGKDSATSWTRVLLQAAGAAKKLGASIEETMQITEELAEPLSELNLLLTKGASVRLGKEQSIALAGKNMLQYTEDMNKAQTDQERFGIMVRAGVKNADMAHMAAGMRQFKIQSAIVQAAAEEVKRREALTDEQRKAEDASKEAYEAMKADAIEASSGALRSITVLAEGIVANLQVMFTPLFKAVSWFINLIESTPGIKWILALGLAFGIVAATIIAAKAAMLTYTIAAVTNFATQVLGLTLVGSGWAAVATAAWAALIPILILAAKIIAVVAVAYGIYKLVTWLWELFGISQIVSEAWKGIKTVALDVWSGILEALDPVIQIVKMLWGVMQGFVDKIGGWGNIILIGLAIAFAPITLAIAVIYGLWKVFDWIAGKVGGWKNIILAALAIAFWPLALVLGYINVLWRGFNWLAGKLGGWSNMISTGLKIAFFPLYLIYEAVMLAWEGLDWLAGKLGGWSNVIGTGLKIAFFPLYLTYEAVMLVWNGLDWVAGKLGGWGNVIKLGLTIAFAPLIAVYKSIMLIWEGFSWLAGKLGAVWDGIKNVASVAWNGVVGAVGAAWDGITSAASAAWDTIASGAGAVGDFIGGVWDSVADGASAAWDSAVDTAGAAYDSIADAASAAWDWITGANEEPVVAMGATAASAPVGDVAQDFISRPGQQVQKFDSGDIIFGMAGMLEDVFGGVGTMFNDVFSADNIGNVFGGVGDMFGSKKTERQDEIVTVKLHEDAGKSRSQVDHNEKLIRSIDKLSVTTKAILDALLKSDNKEIVDILNKYMPELAEGFGSSGLATQANQW